MLSGDENLVLALRLRDGLPTPVPGHRRTGDCKYAAFYHEGACDWCKALDAREAMQAAAEPSANVIVMAQHRQHVDEDAADIRRIA